MGGEEPEEVQGPVAALTAPLCLGEPPWHPQPPAPAHSTNTTAQARLGFFKYFIFVTTSELKIFHK